MRRKTKNLMNALGSEPLPPTAQDQIPSFPTPAKWPRTNPTVFRGQSFPKTVALKAKRIRAKNTFKDALAASMVTLGFLAWFASHQVLGVGNAVAATMKKPTNHPATTKKGGKTPPATAKAGKHAPAPPKAGKPKK